MSRSLTALCLLLVAALAIGLRSANHAEVFPGDGLVELAPADSAYHARRALFSFVNFPAVLVFDPYLAWPDGARVPMPPLYDWALGGFARLFGSDEATFERAVAWASPVIAALTLLPVYAVGCALGGRGVGLGAALLFALLPAGLSLSRLGDVDHHAAVAGLGSAWLALSLGILRRDATPRGVALRGLGLALVRGALLLTWSGSILYVGVGDGALLLACALEGRRLPALAQAGSAALSAALVLPWLLLAAPAVPLAATDLSWLQVVALLAVTLLAGALAWRAGAGGAPAGLGRRLAPLAIAACVVAGLLLLLPGLRESLGAGLGFLARQDSWGARNPEQRSLLGAGGLALQEYGYLALAIPLVPVLALLAARDAARRAGFVCFAVWSAALGALAVAQVRFGGDFAPTAAVGFALLLERAARRASRALPRLAPAPIALCLAALLLWPALATLPGPHGGAPSDLAPGEVVPLSPRRSVTAFARMVRAATPETDGYLDAAAKPEYGILVAPSYGHTFHYMARRATPADNFGPYLDREKYALAQRFYAVADEQGALDVARRLGVRYVVTFARESSGRESFADRLHALDAAVGADAPSEHLRLVVEGPFAGLPLRIAFPSGKLPRRSVPYKLFEIVKGALLEAVAPPGSELEVRVQIATNLGRRIPFHAVAVAGADGRARLRLPYPTDASAPTRSVGPYRVRLGGREARVAVSEEQVREGRTLSLDTAAGGPQASGPSAHGGVAADLSAMARMTPMSR